MSGKPKYKVGDKVFVLFRWEICSVEICSYEYINSEFIYLVEFISKAASYFREQRIFPDIQSVNTQAKTLREAYLDKEIRSIEFRLNELKLEKEKLELEKGQFKTTYK